MHLNESRAGARGPGILQDRREACAVRRVGHVLYADDACLVSRSHVTPVCLFICLFICLFVCLFVCLCSYEQNSALFVQFFICWFIHEQKTDFQFQDQIQTRHALKPL